MANRSNGRGGSLAGSVSVSGPRYDRDRLLNVGVGISVALTAASRYDDGTWYVRENGHSRYAVSRVDGGTIYVTPMGAEDG